MTSRDRDETESFLSRWSQRKRTAKESPPQEAAKREGGGKLDRDAETAGPAAADQERVDPKDLPDIDSLDATSDFTVFLKKGVPQALRRRAMRKLWQVDPAFGEICMLDDYNLDYTDAATVVPNMKTLYQVGKGMVMGDEDDEATAEGGAAAAAQEGRGEDPEKVAEETPAGKPAAGEPEEGVSAKLEDRTAKARRPGDPLVTGSATPRRGTVPAPQRSALRRRWGDSEG